MNFAGPQNALLHEHTQAVAVGLPLKAAVARVAAARCRLECMSWCMCTCMR